MYKPQQLYNEKLERSSVFTKILTMLHARSRTYWLRIMFEPSPVPSARGQSVGHPHSKRVFKTSSSPVGRHLSTRQPLNTTIITWHRCLDRLRLGPWRHPKEQYLFERPHVIGQSRCHGWRTRPPHLRRVPGMCGLGHKQPLAQTGMG
jgi:hypothetical protein